MSQMNPIPTTTIKKYRLLTLAAMCLVLTLAGHSQAGLAAELIMFESEDCHYCDLWKSEIGVIYHKTPQGKKAPLVMLDIDDPLPDHLMGMDAARFTPTFVVWNNGTEAGRITGYPGEDFFWGLFDQILEKLN